MILLRQVLVQLVDGAQVKLAALEIPAREWKPPHDTGHRDPAIRLALAHPEPAHAEIPHRRAGVLGIEPSRIHLSEIREQPHEPLVPSSDMRTETSNQLVVRQVPQLAHAPF